MSLARQTGHESKLSRRLIFGFPQQGLGVFRGSFATPHRLANRLGRTLTLQSSRDHVLVHVIHVVGHDEVLRRGSAAHEGRVQVEGQGQRRQAGVVDDGEAREDLDLLPAVQPLPQRRRHLAQSLPEGTEEVRGFVLGLT